MTEFPLASHTATNCSGVVRYLVLWVTTACNLRCLYCYRPDEPPAVMSKDVALAALELTGASGEPFHVQLAGGEPTLEPELIEFIAQTVRRRGWKATLALQTNATLLDSALISLCIRHAIALGVSLDGPPDVQERLRGAAGATFHNLGLLARKGLEFRVTTVLSGDNVDRLEDLALCLAAYPNARGFGLDPLVLKGRGAGFPGSIPATDQLLRCVRTLSQMLTRVNTRRRVPIVWREREAVAKALSRNTGGAPFCHASLGQCMAVHPNGSVYPCGQSVGDAALAAGTLDAVDWTILQNIYRGVRLRGYCGGCPLEGRCPGDCPSRLRANAARPHHSMCAIYQAVTQDILKKDRTWTS